MQNRDKPTKKKNASFFSCCCTEEDDAVDKAAIKYQKMMDEPRPPRPKVSADNKQEADDNFKKMIAKLKAKNPNGLKPRNPTWWESLTKDSKVTQQEIAAEYAAAIANKYNINK